MYQTRKYPCSTLKIAWQTREPHSNLTGIIIILLFSRNIAFERNYRISVEVKSGEEKNSQAEVFYYTQKHKMQLIDSETHSLKDAKLKKPQHPQQVMG